MNVFISWSGEKSKIMAKALSEFLPSVIQSLDVFFSQSIDKGSRGSDEISKALEETDFGIFCLTPDNLENNWIHYEAGAISKSKNVSRVWTLLLSLNHSDIK